MTELTEELPPNSKDKFLKLLKKDPCSINIDDFKTKSIDYNIDIDETKIFENKF